jgi:antitoxin HicB
MNATERPSAAAKRLLREEMAAQRVHPAELARRMGINCQEVTRLIGPNSVPKVDTIEHALAALGRRLVLSVEAR